ncbi:MAG: zonular occludens toxin domain-containing protein [Pseudomonas sp.]
MLFLRTGLPGAGKTLNAIREVDLEHQADPDNPDVRLYKDPDSPELPPRTIYYYGIPNLKTDKLKSKWVEFEDPNKWFELPDGSVIVVDESQQFFGNDGSRARPEKFSRFETHRHQGLDIHLITQHPSLISPHVRKLVGKHINFIRPYGREKGIFRHEYEFCIDAPEKRHYFKQAQESKVALDPAYFGVYKSSTIHTHKPTKPTYWRSIYIAGAVVAVCISIFVGVGVVMVSKYKKSNEPTDQPVAEVSKQPLKAAPGSATGAQPEAKPVDYLESYKPRIDSAPMSAPRYESIAAPKDFPRLICTSSTDERVVERFRKVGQVSTIDGADTACQCYTQQGTRYKTSVQFCVDAVNNGIFDDTRQARQLATSSGMSLESQPLRRGAAASAAATPAFVQPASQGSSLTIVSDSEYASRPWR